MTLETQVLELFPKHVIGCIPQPDGLNVGSHSDAYLDRGFQNAGSHCAPQIQAAMWQLWVAGQQELQQSMLAQHPTR